VASFAFFGGVPLSILYDNLKIAVAKICGDGKRERTRAFTELISHYLFADRFGRPGMGNDKGKVEGLVKYARANFMTPVPEAASFADLNAMLAARCRTRQGDRAGGMPKPSASVWPPILQCCGRGERCRWNRARSAPAGSRRRRWCAIAATTTRCRRRTAFEMSW
jgi:hypothetical protein